jgi:hypothetical protein
MHRMLRPLLPLLAFEQLTIDSLPHASFEDRIHSMLH